MPTLGEVLRERRQEHRWTLEDVAQRTRIRRDYLQALEDERFDLLPADIQARGFLRNYALVLGLDVQEVLTLYQQQRGAPELASIAPISRPPRTRSFVLPSLGFALLATLITAACASLIYFGWLNPPPPQVTPTVLHPTPTVILPTPTPTVRLIVATPTPSPTVTLTPSAFTGLEAVLQFSAPCWIRVTADGTQVYEGIPHSGATRTFTATHELRIRMGNAGGVRVTLNGQDLGVQGRSGQVIEQVWTKP
jgi:cytoskeleton protein RodZ